MQVANSELAYREALDYIVGGVNSPSRSFKAVGGGSPVFMAKGNGAHIWDVDGNRYIDYLAAYGPLIHGHANAHVADAICQAATQGVLFGCPTEYEVTFAKKLQAAIPALEKVRFVNSGTEAVMTCIRVARAYTGRTKIIKFAGCYHGHSDLVLVAAGSGPSTLGIPDSAGIPQAIANDVITVPYNELDSFQHAMETWGNQVAAVMVEPVVGNFGIVNPLPGFLEQVAEMTRNHGALLIFDEVITAFRFRYGSIADELGVIPDLFAMGKIIGGGLPIGAYGGKRSIMEGIAPLGPTYQAGTMAGNPASILAGIACLEELEKPGTYERMETLGKQLADGLLASARKNGHPVTLNRRGGAFALYFGRTEPVVNYQQAVDTDGDLFAKAFHAFLKRGILLAPSKYEAWFVSTAHNEQDIEETLAAAEEVFEEICRD